MLEVAREPFAWAKALEKPPCAIDEHDVPLDSILADYAQEESTSADWSAALWFRTIFNHVALSPLYTQFAPRMIELLQTLAADERVGSELVLDIVSYMLRHARASSTRRRSI